MANIKSAKKRIRQIAKKTIINASRMNKLRTFVRKVEDAVKSGNKEEAQACFLQAQKVIATTAQKGTLPKNTASRKISNLHLKVKALD